MMDLNGHEAGNGGYSQGKSKVHRVSSTRRFIGVQATGVQARRSAVVGRISATHARPCAQTSSRPMLTMKYSAFAVPTFLALCISLEPITPTSPGPNR